VKKLSSLQPFKEPPLPEREACHACKSFAPDLLVPDGDEAVPMCWLCAHHVVDHGKSMQSALHAKCSCAPWMIYPGRPYDQSAPVVAVGEHGTGRKAS
jgi:hypothetical protein